MSISVLCKLFEKQNPGVEIELINIPGSNYTAKLLSMVAAGTPPDVININALLTSELDGLLVDLTDNMNKMGYFDEKRGLLQGWYQLLSMDACNVTGGNVGGKTCSKGSRKFFTKKKSKELSCEWN